MSLSENRARQGQVVVVFAVALVLLCVVAAFAVDTGNLVSTQSRLQNAADSAALAAMLELWEQRAAGASESNCRTAAEAEAARLISKNFPGAGIDVAWGHWQDGHFVTITSESTPAIVVDAVRVQAERSDSKGSESTMMSFASLFGVDSVEQAAVSTARYQHRGLVPISVYEPDVPAKGQSFTLYNDTETAPGNCGLLNFDGGSESLDKLRNWLDYGYHGDFDIEPDSESITIDGSTGLKSALARSFRDHIAAGSVLVTCVYRSVSGVGSGVTYEIVGFAAVIVEEVTMDKKEEELLSVKARAVSKYAPGTGETEGLMRDFMKLQIME